MILTKNMFRKPTSEERERFVPVIQEQIDTGPVVISMVFLTIFLIPCLRGMIWLINYYETAPDDALLVFLAIILLGCITVLFGGTVIWQFLKILQAPSANDFVIMDVTCKTETDPNTTGPVGVCYVNGEVLEFWLGNHKAPYMLRADCYFTGEGYLLRCPGSLDRKSACMYICKK